jgi:nitrogenase molybdenum-iron protein alpha/beta subunit
MIRTIPKHVKRLNAIQSNKGVKFLYPAATPGSHCPMHTSMHVATSIKGLSSLVIGTSECAYYSRMIADHAKKYNDQDLHYSYVLDANEVVFGCREGLIRAIKEMDAEGAKAIMLIVTCIPELIGEDMEAILYEVQDEVNAYLLPIEVAHFKHNGHPAGIWKTFEALSKVMNPLPKNKNKVNIIGRFSQSELFKEMESKGIELNFLRGNNQLKDFIKAPAATLNIVTEADGLPLAKKMKDRFGIPYIPLHDHYSIKQIEEGYDQIEKELGIWLQIQEEKKQTLLLLENEVKDIGVESGKTFVITNQMASPLPVSLYLTKLGLEPLLLHSEEFYEEDKEWAKELLQLGYNPYIYHKVNQAQEKEIINQLNPSYVLDIVDTRSFGFTRTIKLLESILGKKIN